MAADYRARSACCPLRSLCWWGWGCSQPACCLSSPLPRAGVTLGVMLAQCQGCGSAFDGFRPKQSWKGWVAQEHVGAGRVVLATFPRASCGRGLAAWVWLRGRACVLRWGWGWGSWVREMVPAIRLFLEKCPKDPCFSGTHFEIRKQIFLLLLCFASCCFCAVSPRGCCSFKGGDSVPLTLQLFRVTPADFFRVAGVQPP